VFKVEVARTELPEMYTVVGKKKERFFLGKTMEIGRDSCMEQM
jgi:hypothetical protein